MKIDQRKLDSQLRKLLSDIPQAKRKSLPQILLRKGVVPVIFSTDTYMLQVFLDGTSMEQIKLFQQKGYHPFPGLFSNDANAPCAFNLQGAVNTYLKGNIFENIFAFSLASNDSTAILENQKHTLRRLNDPAIEYQIDLAYLLFWGQNVNSSTYIKLHEDLIRYSLKIWLG